MDDFSKIANRMEAGLWIVIASVLLKKSIQSTGRLRRIFAVLSVTFIVFGISDIIEAQTGAWWRPPWLFFMKAGCVVLLFLGFRAYFKNKVSP